MKYNDSFDHNRPWYGARSLFYDSGNKLYEERIVLLRAISEDEALDKGHKEAKEYAKNADVDYKGYTEVFHIFDESIEEGTEVFSLMRTSDLNAQEYLKRFVATGSEVGITREEV